nr:UDP-N-acetylglucosamine--N-acetylmuramyl-(pentapeptide) pyrophosphoryl-undecaprenol N-acetylglucosamine transferase [Leifsonia shinshuensis]
MAGGGTAGHVNPLLAVADRLRRDDPSAEVLVLGTKEGLEARLVPDRGYELATIPKLPFPRRPNGAALRFPGEYRRAVRTVTDLIRDRGIDVVVGFGGYAAAPAYSAARKAHVPYALHEANARPGLANRLGARSTRWVGVAFEGTPLRHARFVGMPLRREIEELDREASRPAALAEFGLSADRPTLLVTGGSLGARRLNGTIAERAAELTAAGWQVLHIQGGRGELTDPGIEHYRLLDYCDRMDLAFALTDFAVARAGAATVCEFAALGIPAVYVPFPIGNGEQRFNAAGVVQAGGGILVDDAEFLPAWVDGRLLPLLADRAAVDEMARKAAITGVRDGSDRMVALIRSALKES